MKVTRTVTKTVEESFEVTLSEEAAKKIRNLNDAKQLAGKVLDDAVFEWFKSVDPLADEGVYNKILDDYRELILKSRWGMTKVEHAADELVRRVVCDETPYSFEQVIGFWKRYGEIKAKLYDSLFDAQWDKGDDGYGDFIDSIQMVSNDMADLFVYADENFGKITDDAFITKVKKYYQETCGKEWTTWYQGENYISSNLRQALEKFAPIYVNDILALTEEVA